MHILGISAFYHDSAAALLRDGVLVAAAHEERFTRKRHDPALPVHAVRYCLETAGIEMKDVEYVVFYDKPFIKLERRGLRATGSAWRDADSAPADLERARLAS